MNWENSLDNILPVSLLYKLWELDWTLRIKCNFLSTGSYNGCTFWLFLWAPRRGQSRGKNFRTWGKGLWFCCSAKKGESAPYDGPSTFPINVESPEAVTECNTGLVLILYPHACMRWESLLGFGEKVLSFCLFFSNWIWVDLQRFSLKIRSLHIFEMTRESYHGVEQQTALTLNWVKS